jgi:glycerol transport system ATP-binding protein
MNFLPGQVDGDGFHVGGVDVTLALGRVLPLGEVKLGVRPEYVVPVPANTDGALPMTVSQVQDVGTHVMLSATLAGHMVKARLSSDAAQFAPGESIWLQVMGEHTCFYRNEEIVP